MVRWAEGLARETIVRVVGIVKAPPKEMGHEIVKSTSVHRKEVKVEMVRFFSLCLDVDGEIRALMALLVQLHVIAKPSVQLPFQVDNASHSPSASETTTISRKLRATSISVRAYAGNASRTGGGTSARMAPGSTRSKTRTLSSASPFWTGVGCPFRRTE